MITTRNRLPLTLPIAQRKFGDSMVRDLEYGRDIDRNVNGLRRFVDYWKSGGYNVIQYERQLDKYRFITWG